MSSAWYFDDSVVVQTGSWSQSEQSSMFHDYNNYAGSDITHQICAEDNQSTQLEVKHEAESIDHGMDLSPVSTPIALDSTMHIY